MKSTASKFAALGLTAGALFITACGEQAEVPESPDAAIQTVIHEFADGNGGILWEAMPATYQSDVDEVVRLAGSKLDPELYNTGFALIGRIADVAEQQKDFVLNTSLASPDETGKVKIEEAYPSLVGLLRSLADSSIATVDGLQSFDGQRFFETTVSEIAKYGQELSTLSDEASPTLADFKDATVTVVEESEAEATLEIAVPGQEPQTESFTKVEGRWIPSEMANGWATQMEEARTQLNAASAEQMAANKPQVMSVFTMMESTLNQLEAAETQAEFDQALQGAMMPIMGLMMMGQGMGGGSGAPVQAPTAPSSGPVAP